MSEVQRGCIGEADTFAGFRFTVHVYSQANLTKLLGIYELFIFGGKSKGQTFLNYMVLEFIPCVTCIHLKNDGSKPIFILGRPIFSGELLVLGSPKILGGIPRHLSVHRGYLSLIIKWKPVGTRVLVKARQWKTRYLSNNSRDDSIIFYTRHVFSL